MSPFHFFLESIICSLNLRIIRHLLHICHVKTILLPTIFLLIKDSWNKVQQRARLLTQLNCLYYFLQKKVCCCFYYTGFGGYIKWMVTCKNYLLSHSLLFSNRTKLVLSCGISNTACWYQVPTITKAREEKTF